MEWHIYLKLVTLGKTFYNNIIELNTVSLAWGRPGEVLIRQEYQAN